MTEVFRQSIIVPSFAIRQGTINLKAASIFYDRLLVVDDALFGVELPGMFGDDFDFLQEKGIIEVLGTDYQWSEDMVELIETTRSAMRRVIFTHVSRSDGLLTVGANGVARLEAASLTRTRPGNHFVPHTFGQPGGDLLLPHVDEDRTKDLKKVDRVKQATEVIFRNLPVPDELTPWEDIFAFREEHDTHRSATALHRWIRDTSTESRIDEVNVEFAHDMYRLRDAMRARDMKVALARTRMVLPWLDVIHRVAKAVAMVKPSGLAAPIVETQQRRIEILEAETRVRENPLYMIAHAEARFRPRTAAP